MKFTVFTFLLLASLQLYSQTGNYFLSHYTPGEDRFDEVCFDIAQEKSGLVYFATRRGILEFDGRNWNTLLNDGAVYSIQLAPSGELYWAGAAGYGTVATRNMGHRTTTVISPKGVTDVFQCLLQEKKSYFVGEHALYIETPGQATLTVNATKQTGTFGSLFEIFGAVYINTAHMGLFKVDGNKLVRSRLNFSDTEEVVFSQGYDNQYLVGLSDNSVYLVGENLKPRLVVLEDDAYAAASVIVSGTWVNKDLFVLGTLRGGLIFVQASTGKTQEIVNYNTGLPDNEVYALMSDQSQCIWAAHEYGFTRVSPYMPFRSFSHYNGLAGNLHCARAFQGSVYAGTSLGLFKLEKEDLYDEITYFIEVAEVQPQAGATPSATPAPATQTMPTAPADETTQPAGPKRKGFLRFLKKNRNKESAPIITQSAPAEAGTALPPTAATPSATPHARTVNRRIKKTERVLRTTTYRYKKVQGINAKITQLVIVDNKLIAVGLGGAFEIEGLTARPILEEPVRIAYASRNLGMLLVSTYDDDVRAFAPGAKGWTPSSTLNTINDDIEAITDGNNHDLWLCAPDKVYHVDMAAGTLKNVDELPISNPTLNKIACVRWNKEIVLAHKDGFFRFDPANHTFVRIDSLPKPALHFSDGEDILYNDGHTWNILGKTHGQSNLQLLNLQQNLRFVTIDQNGENLWLVTGNNELYKFYGEKLTPYEVGNKPLLKAARNENEAMDLRDFALDETRSSLTFDVIQPDYLAPQSIEYRYQLAGLEDEWSDWSVSNNIINFAYLPSNDYVLMVQSRDIFGKIRELPTVAFEVLPPYWKRPWFYALEFLVFSGLVMLSMRLSSRFRIISRVLSLLTIIMLLQFIQTVIGKTFETPTSPVLDFFIQVVVAFMILPVEGYLRNFMLKEGSLTGRLQRFLTPEAAPADDKKE
ncbi:triple tyrosine motif-containing protein [Dawidia soli]|uniref:Two component regulator three Y domain-containing protein n=1 Tax=Dawidia soli TaxID=2782352 RepID=A0AAP2D4R2_9BACT|nr:triple tyrosine motif-containing protein [Dawidia soli]MBT1685303.1 hypothetical protein [Dawidia soli]